MDQTYLIQDIALYRQLTTKKGSTGKTFTGILLIAMLIICIPSFGQNYKTGIGIRLSPFSGFTLKSFFNSGNAFEGLLTVNSDAFLVTGLYEFQQATTNVEGLDWYIGGGAHLGFMNSNLAYYYGTPYQNGPYDGVGGVDFIIGLEYTFRTAPFSIALDFKPALNIFGPNTVLVDLGLSFRYDFK